MEKGDDFSLTETTTAEDIQGLSKPRVFTTYWANAKKATELGIVLVGVSRFPPRFVKAKTYLPLAPDATMLKQLKANEIPVESFNVKYREQLAAMDAKETHDALLEMGEGKSVAILCYEKPPDTCHRHKIARWLIAELGVRVDELPYKK